MSQILSLLYFTPPLNPHLHQCESQGPDNDLQGSAWIPLTSASTILPLVYKTLVPLAFFLFFKHTEHTPCSGYLHLLFPLLEHSNLEIFINHHLISFRLFLKWDLYIEVFPDLIYKKQLHLIVPVAFSFFSPWHLLPSDMLCVYFFACYPPPP